MYVNSVYLLFFFSLHRLVLKLKLQDKTENFDSAFWFQSFPTFKTKAKTNDIWYAYEKRLNKTKQKNRNAKKTTIYLDTIDLAFECLCVGQNMFPLDMYSCVCSCVCVCASLSVLNKILWNCDYNPANWKVYGWNEECTQGIKDTSEMAVANFTLIHFVLCFSPSLAVELFTV